MKTIGLTGGIGSGKTTVAGMFHDLGVPVYIADDEAKKLMNASKGIRRELVALFGTAVYKNEKLDRKFLAQRIFSDPGTLKKVNAIVHPRVGEHFKHWAKKQKYAYVLKEAAILFENGGYKNCDATILVTAPKHARVQRLLKRGAGTLPEIEARMKNQ
ncbi:MAG: dephospho-CoA kinase, partial [Marinirhabdus sp.]